ncbi:NADH-quinone oxidoreductase subunit C [Streptomyces sp. SID5770]|uniref:NADH-quinone oxidoreductase subunit C n=1 Tax=Streptomyces sp. SID5770 TaxID=2690308 RepID=UPI00136EC25F|nr:NADH-quinone oxidoreductase subunit C [Streptomyces sp. SID5770]MZE56111.1 NADH-quinone oxidoreductase subunit C [Streptomyces sp. SID5770]
MSAYDGLPDAVTEVFGEEATAERAYDLLTVDVPPSSWIAALTTARDELGCTYFDWLSAVDEPGTGFRVCAHVVSLAEGGPRRLLVRTTVPHAAPVLPTAVGVYAGAGWHERETHEMFGVDFTGHPHLVPLLLPENFEGHPLRKDFVLAARVAKAWPGAKEPGESHDGGPKRRQMLPPGVPDPNEWGPLKGQLPPAPTRAERPPRRPRPTPDTPTPQDTPPRRTRSASEGSTSQDAPAAPRRTRSASDGSASQVAGEPGAPVRRTRSAADGSASQVPPEAGDTTADTPPETARPPRRSRSASDGSVSQSTAPGTETPDATTPDTSAPGAEAPDTSARPPRRSRSAADGSASQTAGEPGAPVRRTRSAADGSASQTPPEPTAPRRTRSSDAPWHHARPAFDEEPAAPAKPDTAAEPSAPAEPGTDAESNGPADVQGPAPRPAHPATEPGTGAEGPEKNPDADGPGKARPTDTGTDTDPDPTHPAGGDPA